MPTDKVSTVAAHVSSDGCIINIYPTVSCYFFYHHLIFFALEYKMFVFLSGDRIYLVIDIGEKTALVLILD
jgi:hypothetical protein